MNKRKKDWHEVTRKYEGEWTCSCGATGDGSKEWHEHYDAAVAKREAGRLRP